MQCVIPGRSLKQFSKALQALAKVGEELTIEASRTRLSFNVVDNARTAFVRCNFNPAIFDTYLPTSPIFANGGENTFLRCKIQMKGLVHIFKAKQLEKTIDKSIFTINENESRLVFQHFCKFGITKTHKLIYEDCERPLLANYSRETANIISLPGKTISAWVGGFAQGISEITWVVDQKQLKIQSFSETKLFGNAQKFDTVVTLTPDDGGSFRVTENVNVTFAFKEFKAILGLAEALDLHIEARFSSRKNT